MAPPISVPLLVEIHTGWSNTIQVRMSHGERTRKNATAAAASRRPLKARLPERFALRLESGR